MTYEEAKMQIQAIPEKIWDQLSEPDREAMEMAFSALQAQDSPKPTAESVQNVQNEDLISRKAAIDAECEVCQIAPKKERGHNCTYYVHGCKEIECLRALPSAQPELSDAVYQLWKRAYEAGERSAQYEVIKCENCRHRGEKPISDGRYWCNIHNAFMYYCSDAERRTDESDANP